MTEKAETWPVDHGINISGVSRYTAVSIHAKDEKELPFVLGQAVEGLWHAIPSVAAARRVGGDVTEVSLLIGDWRSDKPRRMTFEELLAEYRKVCE